MLGSVLLLLMNVVIPAFLRAKLLRKAFLLYEANGKKVIEILKHPIKVWITKDIGRGLVWRVEWIR